MADARALQRASLAVSCLPFRRAFYEALQAGPMGSSELAGRHDSDALLREQISADQLERSFIWLIRIGVLRREVDGQGLTERVRLTPLGRQLLSSWPGEIPRAGLLRRLRHALGRYRPRW